MKQTKERKSEFKPLLYTTTVRNPERIKYNLYVLKKYEGQILTNELATEIVGELIRYGLYRPMKVPQNVAEIWKQTPKGEFAVSLISKKDVKKIQNNNPQKHKEAGFAWGYPSRFATIFDLAKELGFVYFIPGEKIEFSELGNILVDIVKVKEENDADALYDRIQKLRKEYGYNPSDEVIFDICVNEIMDGKFKKFKVESLMTDYTDEFIRKMRMSGLISLRGAGRFIDINHNEDKKVDYILETYADYKHYTDEHDYFKYMSSIDKNLISLEAEKITTEQTNDLLSVWLETYNWDNIKLELKNLSSRKPSKDDVLKFLAAPARLEFLTALAIKSKLPNVTVKPNYSCDDTGLPTSTAGGNKGDIECFEEDKGVLVEVTMAEGRTQTMMEIWPIERHLETFIHDYNIDAQCIFTAPTIYQDSKRQMEYVRFSKKLLIRDYPISNFI
ncbi:MAG: AlwI family type II restriction endonuclease [Clostridia bacterium]|nr:AlwI family type II restriction endonuclease [Clostridia bacterium]